MAISLVLDTAVVVAALRSSQGASRQLLLASLRREFELLLSVPLLLEYESVLTRPEHLGEARVSAPDVADLLDDLAGIATRVRLAFRWRMQLPDPEDDMVLETAVNGNAEAIVTFNQKDFAPVAKDFGIKIIPPSAALQQIQGARR